MSDLSPAEREAMSAAMLSGVADGTLGETCWLAARDYHRDEMQRTGDATRASHAVLVETTEALEVAQDRIRVLEDALRLARSIAESHETVGQTATNLFERALAGSVIEVAKAAYAGVVEETGIAGVHREDPMEATIRAADRERGLRVEHRPAVLLESGQRHPAQSRVISDWRDVEVERDAD